jgi:hypothetical protein
MLRGGDPILRGLVPFEVFDQALKIEIYCMGAMTQGDHLDAFPFGERIA